MARFFKKREQSKGLAPGSLVFIGEQKVETTRIRTMDFDNDHLVEHQLNDIDEIATCVKTSTTSWVNIDGLHDTDLMKKVGSIFELHPLLQEDVLNTGQRPKLEDFDNCLFLTLKMLRYDKEEDIVKSEQLSLILGQRFLLTFQERYGDVFDPVRVRIRKSRARIRKSGVDYLAYALLDTVADNYIYLIERMGERIEDLEDELFSDPTHAVMGKIHAMKREMNFLRKSIRPAREAIVELNKTESTLIDDDVRPFLKDLLDLMTHATEAIDMYRDMLTDHFNIYASSVSNKMNDIMKVLTIFAAIFIPLTFVAGVYGTNFKYLPELEYKYAYPIFWSIIILITIFMVILFRRKKWL